MFRKVLVNKELLQMTKETKNNMRLVSVVDDQIDSAALFAKVRELVITHKESEYKLKITSNDKLILTK